jgi:hypothetical protein
VYVDGPFRYLQGAARREEVLFAQLGSHSLLMGEIRKRVQGTDSTCPRCREEEDLEHILRVCPELEYPRRRNFMQVPPLLSAMLTNQAEWPGISGRSLIGISRDRSLLYKQTNKRHVTSLGGVWRHYRWRDVTWRHLTSLTWLLEQHHVILVPG